MGCTTKPSYGGQAVIEGVMMAGPKGKAIAVRNEDGQIIIKQEQTQPWTKRHKILGLPLIRGAVSFVYSLCSGVKDLTWAASQAGETEDEQLTTRDMVGAILGALVLAVGLFVALPVFAGTFLHPYVGDFGRSLVEGVLRLILFLGYILAISRLPDIQRLFAYHGAEHKTINAYEAGVELTPENVRKYSRIHTRCGTSFLIMTMLVMIILFTFVGQGSALSRILTKVLLLPVVAGLSYELFKLPLKYPKSFLVRMLVAPGLATQRLTTREPSDEMLEVAIAALQHVPFWEQEEGAEQAGRKPQIDPELEQALSQLPEDGPTMVLLRPGKKQPEAVEKPAQAVPTENTISIIEETAAVAAAPKAEAPAEAVIIEEKPAEEAPAKEAPAKEAPAKEAPAKQPEKKSAPPQRAAIEKQQPQKKIPEKSKKAKKDLRPVLAGVGAALGLFFTRAGKALAKTGAATGRALQKGYARSSAALGRFWVKAKPALIRFGQESGKALAIFGRKAGKLLAAFGRKAGALLKQGGILLLGYGRQAEKALHRAMAKRHQLSPEEEAKAQAEKIEMQAVIAKIEKAEQDARLEREKAEARREEAEIAPAEEESKPLDPEEEDLDAYIARVNAEIAKEQEEAEKAREAAAKAKAQGSSGNRNRSNSQHRSNKPKQGGGQNQSNKPKQGGGQNQSSKPHQGSGQNQSNKPKQGSGQNQSNKPKQGGGQNQSNKPKQGSGQKQSNKPQQGGGQNQPNKPKQGGGQNQSNKPHQGGGQNPSNKPQQGGGQKQSSKPHQGGGQYQSNKPKQGSGQNQSNKPKQGGGQNQSNKPKQGGGQKRPHPQNKPDSQSKSEGQGFREPK